VWIRKYNKTISVRYIGHILPRLEVTIAIKKLKDYAAYMAKLTLIAEKHKEKLRSKKVFKGLLNFIR